MRGRRGGGVRIWRRGLRILAAAWILAVVLGILILVKAVLGHG